jgi:hypothetical protein
MMERKHLFQRPILDLDILVVMTGVYCHRSQRSVFVISKSTFERLRCLHTCIAPPDLLPVFPKPNEQSSHDSDLMTFLSTTNPNIPSRHP